MRNISDEAGGLRLAGASTAYATVEVRGKGKWFHCTDADGWCKAETSSLAQWRGWG